MVDTTSVDYLRLEIKSNLASNIIRDLISKCIDINKKFYANNVIQILGIDYIIEYICGFYRVKYSECEYCCDDSCARRSNGKRICRYPEIFNNFLPDDFFNCLMSTDPNCNIEISGDDSLIHIQVEKRVGTVEKKYASSSRNSISKSKPSILILKRKPIITIKPIR